MISPALIVRAFSIAGLCAFSLAACDVDWLNTPAAETKYGRSIDAAATRELANQTVSMSGRVVGVVDGDTIDILVDGREVRVRLAEIDAPERSQPWYARSSQALRELVHGRDVSVVQTDTDRWGRVVGRIYIGDTDVNARMVEIGAAWAFLRYQTDPRFSGLEADARARTIGLWSMPPNEIIAPWDWRAGARVEPHSALGHEQHDQPMGLIRIQPPSGAADFTCGTKNHCSEMVSCEEARFYLNQCRLPTLDGDGDGVPCDQLCAPAN